MPRTVHWIVPSDPSTLDPLLQAVGARGTELEEPLRAAARLQHRPFGVFIDYANQLSELSPLFDAFTFDMDTDELIVYTVQPEPLVDALIEMAMYMQGFTTLMGVDAGWKVELAIGGWRRIRQAIRRSLDIADEQKGKPAVFSIQVADRFTVEVFSAIVRLAGYPDAEVIFPPEASPQIVNTYRHMVKIVDVISHGLTISDPVEFNQRLMRALDLIEEKFSPSDLPRTTSPDDPNGG